MIKNISELIGKTVEKVEFDIYNLVEITFTDGAVVEFSADTDHCDPIIEVCITHNHRGKYTR